MPCRKESYLFVEGSVTVDSKEMDGLVVRLEETLQLSTGNHRRTASSCPCSHHATAIVFHNRFGGGAVRCLPSKNPRSRVTPYCTPNWGSRQESRYDGRMPRSWKGKEAVGCSTHGTSDPHQLLEELLLSGNLIKEAVRRLQLVAATGSSKTGDPATADGL